MSNKIRSIITLLCVSIAVSLNAQSTKSSVTVVQRNNPDRTVPKIRGSENSQPVISINETQHEESPEANIAWQRIVYKELDLNNEDNAVLYYPEEYIEGSENLFRIIINGLTTGHLEAFEYLNGHEVFTPEFKINVPETLEKFYIPYTVQDPADGKTVQYKVDPYDIPSSEILSYYIIEQWQFDNIDNKTRSKVIAICPVLHRVDDFGVGSNKYPMFWVLSTSLEPLIKNTRVFVNEYDVTPKYSYQDFFDLNLYNGSIYKTRNLRNKSLHDLYADDDIRHAVADSIDKSLKEFDKNLWVPSREEILSARNAKDAKNSNLGEIPQRREIKQSIKRSTRGSSGEKTNTPNQSVTRSVRDRK